MFDFENGDINMLISLLNMKLRDEFSSFDEFINYNQLDKIQVLKRLKENGYEYVSSINQFKRI